MEAQGIIDDTLGIVIEAHRKEVGGVGRLERVARITNAACEDHLEIHAGGADNGVPACSGAGRTITHTPLLLSVVDRASPAASDVCYTANDCSATSSGVGSNRAIVAR
jgi:hypothetical protein